MPIFVPFKNLPLMKAIEQKKGFTYFHEGLPPSGPSLPAPFKPEVK